MKRNYFIFRADGLFNVSNAMGGYNPNRLSTISVFAGIGLTFAKTYRKRDQLNTQINGSVGLMGQFNVAKLWDINIEARGEIFTFVFGIKNQAYSDGVVSLTARVTYTFGGKKFVSCSNQKVDEDAINVEINKYRNELARAKKELAEIKIFLGYVKPVIQDVIKEGTTISNPIAIFLIGSATIDSYIKVNLQLVAKAMKANPIKKT